MTALLVTAVVTCVALGALRFVRGPTHADRIVAVDVLFSAALALCTAAALETGRVLFLDIAIGVALTGFVATLAWARVVERPRAARREKRR